MIHVGAPWLLVAGLACAALVVWRLRQLPRAHAGVRRRVVQGLMGMGVLSAALALGELEWATRRDRLAVVFALDRSRSVERAADGGATRALAGIREAIEEMRSDDRAGIVVFGAEAATEVVPGPAPVIGAVQASIPRDATDLSAAIRRALGELPADFAGRIVLVSDGVETRGDALSAATLAAARGVTIDVLALERAPAPEVAVAQVRLPERADPREPLALRIVTRATRETEVDVRVLRDGEPFVTARTRLGAGDDVLTVRDVADAPGVHRYDVLLDAVDPAHDAARENNTGAALVRVSGGARALVLSDRPEESEALAAALVAAGFEVALRDRATAPSDLGTLAGFDLVVLSDLNARAFTQAGLVQLEAYVRDLGGGLLMLGARDAFGLGGYASTPVEDALPATFDLRKRRDRASLAMVIAIDKSGSMSAQASPGVTKLDLANEAAARSAQLLSPIDHVGVAHVDTEVSWTVPLAPVQDPAGVAARVRRATVGGGGILVDLTLEAAYDALRTEPVQLKHLLLFSDGSDSEEMTRARGLVRDAAAARITTSIVSMGNGPDTPELEQLSRIGGGRFYIVDDLTELPRIFTQETLEASRAAVVEEPTRALPGAPGPVTRGLDLDAAPTLAGYVAMNPRTRAQRLLGATREDPLLLVWQHGLGRSATFAADAGASLTRAWLGWEGYGVLFGQLARDLARAPEQRDARVTTEIRGGRGRVRVEAVDVGGRYRNYLDLSAIVAGPEGRPITVALTQTGAGRYEGAFSADAPGAYLVTVNERERGLVGSAGAVRAAGDELRGEGTDHAKLAQLAGLTGGRVLRDLRESFGARPAPVYAYAPLWPALVTLALLLLLASVAARRLVLPPALLARVLPARLHARLVGKSGKVGAKHDKEVVMSSPGAVPRAASPARSDAEHAPPVDALVGRSTAPTSSSPAAPDDAPQRDAPAPPQGPAAPASLAERLLERRKKR